MALGKRSVMTVWDDGGGASAPPTRPQHAASAASLTYSRAPELSHSFGPRGSRVTVLRIHAHRGKQDGVRARVARCGATTACCRFRYCGEGVAVALLCGRRLLPPGTASQAIVAPPPKMVQARGRQDAPMLAFRLPTASQRPDTVYRRCPESTRLESVL